MNDFDKNFWLAILIAFVVCGFVKLANGAETITDHFDDMACMMVGEDFASFVSPPFTKTHLGEDAWLLENSRHCSWRVRVIGGEITKATAVDGPCTFNRRQFVEWGKAKGCFE